MHSFGVTWLTGCILGSNFVFLGSCLTMWGLVLNPKYRQQIYERVMRCATPKYGMIRIFVSYNQDHYTWLVSALKDCVLQLLIALEPKLIDPGGHQCPPRSTPWPC